LSTNLKFTLHEPAKGLKLDLGTGKGASRPAGFIGVDLHEAEGVEVVTDLRAKWPWKANSVAEAQANYLVQYLTRSERVHFANELYRVLQPGGTAIIMVPHWASSRAYGDLLVEPPAISEMWFATLNKDWRNAQNSVDKSGYTCDFDHTLGYGLHPAIIPRNQEYQQHAVTFWKEAAQDIIATLTARK
jgi:hypothetical protein